QGLPSCVGARSRLRANGCRGCPRVLARGAGSGCAGRGGGEEAVAEGAALGGREQPPLGRGAIVAALVVEVVHHRRDGCDLHQVAGYDQDLVGPAVEDAAEVDALAIDAAAELYPGGGRRDDGALALAA